MNLVLEKDRNALIRLSQFVLAEETERIRDDLQEKIIEAAFFWGAKDEEFVSIDEVAKLVAKEIRIIKFPDEMLDDIVSRLLAKGSIIENEQGAYKLSVLRQTEFGELVSEKRRRIDRINGQFLILLEREYGKKLTDEQKKEGLEKLYSLLTSLALEKSDLVARVITQKNLENLPMEMSIHKLYGILGEIEEIDLRNAEFRAIKLMFRTSSEDFCRFLFSLTQNLICIQILNLDPECRALERKAFSEKRLFLDTNVLIGLVCPTDWQHKPAMQIVKLSGLLGAKCLVTKTTCDEYSQIIEEANRIFKKWQAPLKFLKDADNEFLTSFWSEKQTNKSLSWKSYYQRTRDVGKILTEHGIQLFVESLGKIRNNQHFESVMTQVNTCYQSVKGKKKGPPVCEHDALLMLLVRELRREAGLTLLGPNYWFITGDESLLCVDNLINSIPEFSDKTPSSMISALWLQMISPFLPLRMREKDAYEAFSMIVKHQFALVPFQIDAQKLVKIQGSWTKYEWLEAKDIIRIQNREWTRQYLRRLEKAKKKGQKEKAEEMGKIFAKKLEDELRKIRDEKLIKLAREKKAFSEREAFLSATIDEKMKQLEDQQSLIEAQERDIEQKQYTIRSKESELEKEIRFKRQLRVVSTIAGLFLIISPLLLMVSKSLPIMLESVAFCSVSLIVGAILLYFGIAPERAHVSVEAKISPPDPKRNDAYVHA